MAMNPSVARGIDHSREARLGARAGGGGAGTIGCCVSVTSATTAAGWIVGLAILALIASGWRKPARATTDPSRALMPRRAARRGVPVEEYPTESYRRAPIWRRIWAALASSSLAVILGAVLATLVGYGAAWFVIRLSDMLRK